MAILIVAVFPSRLSRYKAMNYKRPRDPNQLGKSIVDIATGQAFD